MTPLAYVAVFLILFLAGIVAVLAEALREDGHDSAVRDFPGPASRRVGAGDREGRRASSPEGGTR